MQDLEQIGSFVAKDASGTEYRIGIYKNPLTPMPFHLPTKPQPPVLLSEDGFKVARLSPGRFRIMSNPEIELVSDDPNAP